MPLAASPLPIAFRVRLVAINDDSAAIAGVVSDSGATTGSEISAPESAKIVTREREIRLRKVALDTLTITPRSRFVS